ncbi:reverse transcriptase domain-containing protein [Tanacetum coccineum]
MSDKADAVLIFPSRDASRRGEKRKMENSIKQNSLSNQQKNRYRISNLKIAQKRAIFNDTEAKAFQTNKNLFQKTPNTYRCREQKEADPINFGSRTLRARKSTYTPMEKLDVIFGTVQATIWKKIHPRTHVVVITNQPIKAAVSKFGTIWKNAEVKFRARRIRHPIQTKTAIKRPNIGDYIRPLPRRRLRVSLILTNPKAEFTYAMRLRFEALTMKAEYEAQNTVSGSQKKWKTFRGKKEGTKEILSKDTKKARAVRQKAASMHSGPRSVVAKAIQIGYYWPTMHMDARNLIRKCKDCQIHHPLPKNTQQNLTPITSPWLFYKWGIDIAGPFPEGPGKVKFLIVAIDYFTKWIEAKAVTTITGNQVKKFVWDNIVCRFGLPGEIISDNGKQFRDNPFKDWCEKLCIRQCFASVKHPQANGLVERANRSLGEGIKARLDERSRDWIEELPHVLWAHRTMIKSSNGETPFSLTYGTEAVIPVEIGMPTLRTTEVDQASNNEALGINLDLIEERREQAAIQEAKSKKKMEKYYNSRVRGTSFKPGEMVYRSNEASHAKDGGKLGPKWEGPYEVKESLGKGAYKLKDRKGNDMPRTWNICNLKKCYIHEM